MSRVYYQYPRHECRPYRIDIQKALANRAAFQATQTKLPAQVFLGRQSEQHKNPNLVHAHRKLVTHSNCQKNQAKMVVLKPFQFLPSTLIQLHPFGQIS